MGALAHLPGGESGETDSLLDELVQVGGGNFPYDLALFAPKNPESPTMA